MCWFCKRFKTFFVYGLRELIAYPLYEAVPTTEDVAEDTTTIEGKTTTIVARIEITIHQLTT